MTKIVVRDEGTEVVLIIDGKATSMPHQIAESVGRALINKAKVVEEIVNVEKLIFDNAILHRAGAPIGLSNNPKVLEETKKEALHNTQLRRYMPRIKGKGFVFPPSIRNANENF